MKKTIFVLILFLCVFSILIIISKKINFLNKEKERKQIIKNSIENTHIDEQKEKVTFQDGIIGMILIPSLEIDATIKEGTGGEILKYWVRTF